MADVKTDDKVKTNMLVSFSVLDGEEGDRIGEDLRAAILQRMEYHGFHPEGVVVLWETR